MKNQTFGIEIEFTGMTRELAGQIIGATLCTDPYYEGGGYRTWANKTHDGRIWRVMSDGSVNPKKRDGTIGTDEHRCEFVSPICTYQDIETIQEIVRALRNMGAFANSSCGIHVHIGANGHTAKSLKNIASIMASKETLLFKALKVREDRVNRWCQKVDDSLLNKLEQKRPKTLDEVKQIWYNGNDGSRQHYHSSRYHALNLHSVWQKGTIEFRMFNGSMHAGKIKAYIQLAMAISNQAKNQKGASRKETASTNEKFTFRTWLIRLGMNGEEFKTARLHLLSNLDGDIAFKHGRPTNNETRGEAI